jgi:hypothetical protein
MTRSNGRRPPGTGPRLAEVSHRRPRGAAPRSTAVLIAEAVDLDRRTAAGWSTGAVQSEASPIVVFTVLVLLGVLAVLLFL